MPNWPTTCSGCGQTLNDLPDGEPCGECGDTARTTHVAVSDVIAVTDSVSYTLTYGGRPWQELWRRLLRAHARIVAIYDGVSASGQSTDDWRDAVDDFAVDCHHLADWINNDSAVPPGAQNAVWAYLNGDGDLALAQDFSNSVKHRDRKNPSARRVYVESVSGGSAGGGSITLAWDVGGVTQGRRDARDLADACVAKWRAFFTAHGLKEP
ncbi:MAG: hypothetical protein H0T98_03595 [Euzebyaceae bacterium]|nr:hypothetical protein [Euzebyaceae bacterium]